VTEVLREHAGYFRDDRRLGLYRRAFAALGLAGKVVVDLGSGTGVLGLLALHAGARRVYSIDGSAAAELAAGTFERSAYADRATVLRGSSFHVEIAEKADVAVCDNIGCFGFDYGIVGMLGDARRRLLAPGAEIVPSRIRLDVAAVTGSPVEQVVEVWNKPSVPAELHWIRQWAVDAKHLVGLDAEHVLSPPVSLGTIDLTMDGPEFHRWTAELTIERDGLVRGLGGWFHAELAPGIWMTNSPLDPERIDRAQALLPIGEAVPVRAGDTLKATVMARPDDDLIAWTVEFPRQGRRFSHSTWQGLQVTATAIARTRPDRVPRLNAKGRARAVVLGYCDGVRTAAEIERLVLAEHPNLMPSRDETVRVVAGVLAGDAY
jgi:protein arginine N-methyltransferase 1